jgi:17beta-estradiol 17-dehydrogenase / very-long-chain 3-oxoacyl-CoA reductase
MNKLIHAQNELLKEFKGIEVKVFSMDASNADENVFNQFKSFIESDFISILVNNVGVHNDIPTNVVDMNSNEVRRIINVNCTFQVEFTSLIIPKLRQTAAVTRKKSLVMNISSLTSKMAMPMLSLYAATKAFEEHFSLSLAAELAPDRIDCLCLRPGITVSRMSGIKVPSYFCPSAKDMAHSIVNQISSAGNDVTVVPYFPHSILDYINSLVPQQISWGIVREMHNVKRKLLLEQKSE